MPFLLDAEAGDLRHYKGAAVCVQQFCVNCKVLAMA